MDKRESLCEKEVVLFVFKMGKHNKDLTRIRLEQFVYRNPARTMTLKNRFGVSATWEKYGNRRWPYDRQALRHLWRTGSRWSRSDRYGLCQISWKKSSFNAGMMGMYNDSFIKEYQKLTQLVHDNDSKIVMQLAYGGTKTTAWSGERVIFAPSEVPEKGTQTLGKAMTKDEIDYIVDAFARCLWEHKNCGLWWCWDSCCSHLPD